MPVTETDEQVDAAPEVAAQDVSTEEVPVQTPEQKAFEDRWGFEKGGDDTVSPKPEAKFEDTAEAATDEPADDKPSEVNPETAPAEEEAPKTPEWEKSLLDRAAASGFSEAIAKGMGTPEALEAALTAVDSQVDRKISEFGRDDKEEAAPSETPAAEQATDVAAELDGLKYKIDLNEEDYDPEVLKAFNGLNDHYASLFDKMAEGLKGVVNHLQDKDQEAYESRFDAKVSGLGESYKDILGGDVTSAMIDPKSEQGVNRKALLDEITTYTAGREKLGLPALSEGEVFNRALRSALGDKVQGLARKELSTKIKKRSGQMTARPTNREGKETNPTKRAEARARQILESKGMEVFDEGNDEDFL